MDDEVLLVVTLADVDSDSLLELTPGQSLV